MDRSNLTESPMKFANAVNVNSVRFEPMRYQGKATRVHKSFSSERAPVLKKMPKAALLSEERVSCSTR